MRAELPWLGLYFFPSSWLLHRRRNSFPGVRVVLPWVWILGDGGVTIGVQFESLRFKSFDILYFFIDFCLSFLDLSVIEFFETDPFVHFKNNLSLSYYTMEKIRFVVYSITEKIECRGFIEELHPPPKLLWGGSSQIWLRREDWSLPVFRATFRQPRLWIAVLGNKIS